LQQTWAKPRPSHAQHPTQRGAEAGPGLVQKIGDVRTRGVLGGKDDAAQRPVVVPYGHQGKGASHALKGGHVRGAASQGAA